VSTKIKAGDGTGLTGYFFEREQPLGSALLCCATAVHQKFYWPFARWLHSSGFNVLTFDYRGIGESLNAPTAKESTARKQDWGELDMPAALDWLQQRSGNLPLHLVGHSAGGVLVGLMPNCTELSSVVAIGCSSGQISKIAMPERIGAAILLQLYFPFAIKLFGYLPAKKLGWGEDLPPGVAKQWAQWCLSPGYIRSAFGNDVLTNHYDAVRCPISCTTVSDDPITTPSNVDDFLGLFPNATIQRRVLEPAKFGLQKVGHMGFFRTRNSCLWPEILPGLLAPAQPIDALQGF